MTDEQQTSSLLQPEEPIKSALQADAGLMEVVENVPENVAETIAETVVEEAKTESTQEQSEASIHAATTTFHILAETFAILRLPPEIVRGMPEFVFQSSFYTISRSPSEVSIVCEERLVVRHVDAYSLGNIAKISSNWRILKLGVMDLSLTGVAARFAGVLAEHGVNLNIIATFDTDYVMIPQAKFSRAVKALREAGYVVE
jgi:hypothetical protein